MALEGNVKLVGILFLFFGGAIAVAAIALLPSPVERACFIAAGVALELLGLILLARDYAHDAKNALGPRSSR